jgi:hypothetical protein
MKFHRNIGPKSREDVFSKCGFYPAMASGYMLERPDYQNLS